MKSPSGWPPVYPYEAKSVSAKPQVFSAKFAITMNERLSVNIIMNEG